ncbi:hypothetical protein NC652_002685 [Populus alba x Populus x berolinensis]|nr:hypothetical protein NC652_002685 [Populus alba x Populus x berolinensis]
MAVTKEELEFLETRKLLKEQIRKRNFIQESKSKLQTQIPQHRAVSVDSRTKVQRLRQTRDYSFLFSDDNNLTPPVSSATPAQASVPSTKHYADVKGLREFNDPKLKPKQPAALACSILKPLTNKRVMEKITSRMSLQYPCTDKRKLIVKAVHPTKQLAGSNDRKGPRRPNDATLNPKQPVKPHEMTNKRVRDDRNTKMEASFGDITREEKRSERLGRKEDREQLRLSEENLRHQRMRKHNQRTKSVI